MSRILEALHRYIQRCLKLIEVKIPCEEIATHTKFRREPKGRVIVWGVISL